MSAVVSAVKLQLNRRSENFLTPLYIIAGVAVISVIIALIFWRAGSEPGTEGWIQGSQANPGIAYAMPGFFGYFGVSAVAVTFPFALTLGITRRAFVAGTILWNAFIAAYVAVVLAVLNLVEQATNHWFVGFYIFDVNVLGAGSTPLLLAIVFLGVFAVLSVCQAFAAAWVRFGSRGPQLLAAGLILVLGVAAIVFVPEAAAIAAAFQLWWLAVIAGAAIVVSAAGTWLLLRPATVR